MEGATLQTHDLERLYKMSAKTVFFFYQAYAKHLHGICRAHAGHMLGICKAYAQHVRGLCPAYAWHMLGICPACAYPDKPTRPRTTFVGVNCAVLFNQRKYVYRCIHTRHSDKVDERMK